MRMRTFIIFKQTINVRDLTCLTIPAGKVSVHTPDDLEMILDDIREGDVLIIESIHVFSSINQLYYSTYVISNLCNARLYSINEAFFRFENGNTNDSLIDLLGTLAIIEENGLKQVKNKEDAIKKLEKTKKLTLKI